MSRLVSCTLAGLFCTLVASSALAQRNARPASSAPIEIRGQVRMAQGGAPAENIIVRLESFSGGSVGEMRTDRSGKFYFPSLVPGQYTVVIRAFGFREIQRPVDLQTVTTDYVFVQLSPDSSANTATPRTLPPAGSVDANVPVEALKEFEKGREAVQNKRISEGLPHLQSAITIYPKYLAAHILLGVAFMDDGKWDQAAESLRRAIAINPKATTAVFALGDVYRHQKKYAEAEKILNEGLMLDDKSAMGHFTLGRVYWERNDYVKAGPQVGRALQLRPDYADAHLLAGNILLRARHAEEALTEFQEYLRLAPTGEFAEQARQISQKIRDAMAAKKK